MTPQEVEERRLEHQVALDAARTAAERNEWGQFATPPALAEQIVREAAAYLEGEPIAFLDPAIGSGAFFSTVLRMLGRDRLGSARGVELDERFASAARELWGPHGLEVQAADFTRLTAPEGGLANLLIANPPYVRHHHLNAEAKRRLQYRAMRSLGIDTSGLAGLYVHFLLLSHEWMRDGGVAAWLIPSEWMSVNYGSALRRYLTEHVQLLRLHTFEAADVQFGDALVSSSVTFFRKAPPEKASRVRITQGGNLDEPHFALDVDLSTLRAARKWTAVIHHAVDRGQPHESRAVISDLFKIRRGIATGRNPFFIRPLSEWDRLGVSRECLRPMMPPSRQLDDPVIETRPDGYPDLPDPLALLDTSSSPDEMRERYPGTWAYLDSPEGADVRETYLASRRTPWYSQESRDPSPFLSTYMGRRRNGAAPFRVFANRSKAIATNGYLMLYPIGVLAAHLEENPEDDERIAALLQEITAGAYRTHGREYGGGLHKLEPSELSSLPADTILDEIGLSVDVGAQMMMFAL